MKRITWLSVAAVAAIFLASFKRAPYSIERIYAELETRQLKAGKYVSVKGEVCYEGNGNMISHYFYPKNYVLLSNKTGEVKLYDPGANTVVLSQNNLFSSQTSQFYYFFSGKSADMGLSDMGYVQEKVYAEKDMLVSLWRLKKASKSEQVQKIKLVHQHQRPIYMHYENAAGGVLRKVYYYEYTPLDNMFFPATSTEIVYQGKDSAVTKTAFRNFKLNQEANSPYFNYKIPPNAKIQRL
jgi:outer membrane lipoprotein-sorting protein